MMQIGTQAETIGQHLRKKSGNHHRVALQEALRQWSKHQARQMFGQGSQKKDVPSGQQTWTRCLRCYVPNEQNQPHRQRHNLQNQLIEPDIGPGTCWMALPPLKEWSGDPIGTDPKETGTQRIQVNQDIQINQDR